MTPTQSTLHDAAPRIEIPSAAWVGHHLVYGDKEVVDKRIRRKNLAPTVAAEFASCPAKASVKNFIPWNEDPFAANNLGTSYHSVMEELMVLPKPERTRERATIILRQHADKVWATDKLEKRDRESLRLNKESRDRWIAHIEKLLDGQFQIEDPRTVNLFAVENQLYGIKIAEGVPRADDPAIPIGGYIDRSDLVGADAAEVADRIAALVPDPELVAKAEADRAAGKRVRDPLHEARTQVLLDAIEAGKDVQIVVVDLKGGKAKLNPDLRYGDDYGDQLRTYTAAYAARFGVMPTGAELHFPQGPGKRKIDISPNEMRKTLIGLRNGWDTMNQSADRQSFEARPSALCGWCPLVNSCPVATVRSDKAKAAAKEQPSALELGIPHLPAGSTFEQVAAAAGRVTVPVQVHAEPDRNRPIEPVGDDLFPVTLEPVPDGLPGVTGEQAEAIEQAAAQRMRSVQDPSDNEGTDEMTVNQHPSVRGEVAAHEETIQTTNGVSLNLNSYAAQATAGIVSLAAETLDKGGVKLSKEAISRFSIVLAGMVLRVQTKHTGQASYQRGAQSRLRGFLRTWLDVRPAPFGGTFAEWQSWMTRGEAFLSMALVASVDLWESRDAVLEDQETSLQFFASDGAADRRFLPDTAFPAPGA